MLARTILLILLVFSLGGCSSPFKLVVHNETRYPMVVEIKWREDDRDDGQTWELEPGEAKKQLVWYGSSPDRFEVKVNGMSSQEKVITRAEYPKEMARGAGSMGPVCHLHITDGKWRMTGPTAMDNFQDSVPYLLSTGCCCGGPFLLAVALARRSKRRREA